MESQPKVESKEERAIRRRVARAAKREKERSASVVHAAKMHEVRLQDDLRKNESPPTRTSRFHVGCSGWFYWHLRGNFYPEDMPRADWFHHYATNFDTVELNAPFYTWPTIATVKTWIKQAEFSNNFIYTIKVSELITHVKKFDGTKDLVLDFGVIADILGSRFGCFLFQFPPSYTYTPERLTAIVNQLDPTRRNVVEFRHKSWWNEAVYRSFRELGIIFCSCSGPRLPEELIKTADEIYIRFHGVSKWYRHDYSLDELKVWADRIHKSEARQVWCYFNNDHDGYAIKNAKQLLQLLKEFA